MARVIYADDDEWANLSPIGVLYQSTYLITQNKYIVAQIVVTLYSWQCLD